MEEKGRSFLPLLWGSFLLFILSGHVTQGRGRPTREARPKEETRPTKGKKTLLHVSIAHTYRGRARQFIIIERAESDAERADKEVGSMIAHN